MRSKKAVMRAAFLSILLLLSVPPQPVIAQNQSKRCEATTKKGTQCKNKAINNTNYCQVHQAQSPNVAQCKARTQRGTRCSRPAKTAGYCTQHYKMHREGRI